MRLLVLTAPDVYEVLPVNECATVMREAFISLARGEMFQPLRTIVRPPGAGGHMAIMPAYRSGADGAYGVKVVAVFRGNAAIGLDSHQGVVVVFSAETGVPLAVLNASAVTEVRTAAVSAVATDLLARSDSTRLAIVGAGVQARSHVLALARVRPFREIRVTGRDRTRVATFVEDLRGRVPVPMVACDTIEAALGDADVIVTATKAVDPVLRREWVPAGAHINAVGSAVPGHREVDTATMLDAAVFVDRRESTLSESGDFLLAAEETGIGPDHIRGEIGELLVGTATGRTDDKQITVFTSVGLAMQDLAAATFAYQQAIRLGIGSWISF